MSTLETFFKTMQPFLLGSMTIADVESKLGPSPSGTERMAFYRNLVEWGHANFVEKLYPFALERLGKEADGLVETYLQEQPPNHWEPNQVGAGFPDFLAGRDDVPAWISELARYEWFEFKVYLDRSSTDVPKGAELRVNPTMHAISFEYDVPAWIQDKKDDDDFPNSPPGERPHVLLVVRHPDSRLCRFLEATPWVQILITAIEAAQDPVQAAVEAGGSPEDALRILADLRTRGLLLGGGH